LRAPKKNNTTTFGNSQIFMNRSTGLAGDPVTTSPAKQTTQHAELDNQFSPQLFSQDIGAKLDRTSSVDHKNFVAESTKNAVKNDLKICEK
jgi:hypothetical protein